MRLATSGAAPDWVPESVKGSAVGLYIGDECVAAGGIRPVMNGVGEAYLIYAKDPKQYPSIALIAKAVFHHLIQDYTRVQALINLYKPERLRFARWLGMRPEGVVCDFAGETYVTYVTIAGVDR